MKGLLHLHDRAADAAAAAAPWLLPPLARIVFAGVLFVYFFRSAGTKLDGIFTPSLGAYVQILPRAMEAAGYDIAQLSLWHRLIVLAGSWAEYALPVLIVVGLATRLAALGMIGFVAVQSWVDVHGHGLGAADIGAWFDGNPAALLLDQRAFWILLLAVLVLKGAGPLSADRLLARLSVGRGPGS